MISFEFTDGMPFIDRSSPFYLPIHGKVAQELFRARFKPFKLGRWHNHTVWYSLVGIWPGKGYQVFIAPFMGFAPFRPDRCNVIIGLS